ncbi:MULTISPECIES: hypothetical protein [unclassified Sphingomonas]|uniref:hypothetical protein n=1 Tax=unclassified Sphingomonas TaxID=196159 RepID=UPI0012E14D0F|nr:MULTISPECIES: hypothetical protein [unclassified Sphingomonas]MBD8550336.1 hypothetical protein [Sphingomonas sp. CFBP 8764]
MSDRDVWVTAGAIVAEHGTLTADYINEQLGDVLGNRVAVEGWRRVAAAVDAITDTNLQ